MNGRRILIVEDERAVREMIAFGLRRKGFEAEEAGDAASALALIAESHPDLVLLDWMLPAVSGLDLVRSLKADGQTSKLALIMLTARAEARDIIEGLESGVDDTMTKPFSLKELLARINAVLRRSPSAASLNGGAPGWRFEDLHRRVTVGSDSIHLGPTEHKLLSFFVTHPERAYSRHAAAQRGLGRRRRGGRADGRREYSSIAQSVGRTSPGPCDPDSARVRLSVLDATGLAAPRAA